MKHGSTKLKFCYVWLTHHCIFIWNRWLECTRTYFKSLVYKFILDKTFFRLYEKKYFIFKLLHVQSSLRVRKLKKKLSWSWQRYCWTFKRIRDFFLPSCLKPNTGRLIFNQKRIKNFKPDIFWKEKGQNFFPCFLSGFFPQRRSWTALSDIYNFLLHSLQAAEQESLPLYLLVYITEKLL